MATEKNKVKTIRVSPEEQQIIQEKADAADVSWSRYVREVALGELPQYDTDFSKYDHVAVLRNLRKEINMMGKNLNQLTRIAHQTGQVDRAQLEKIRGYLYELKMEILNQLT